MSAAAAPGQGAIRPGVPARAREARCAPPGAHPALPRTALGTGRGRVAARPAPTPRPRLEGHPRAARRGLQRALGRHHARLLWVPRPPPGHPCPSSPGPPGSSAARRGGRRHFEVTSLCQNFLPRAEGTRGVRYRRGPGTDHVCGSGGCACCSRSPLRRDCGRGSAAPRCRGGAGRAPARSRLGAVVVVTASQRRSAARKNYNSHRTSGVARRAPARHWRLPLPASPHSLKGRAAPQGWGR